MKIIYLNETSKEFYALCDGKRNVKQILDELLAVYDVAKEELEQDIIGLIRGLQWNEGAVERRFPCRKTERCRIAPF